MNNKTFRLFISSTFNDFLLEREILNNEIYPDIDDFCKSKGYSFQIVDLRWGVTTESALNQKTISICIDEVKRCKNLSPRPNFMLMIGERYGWIPLPPYIAKTDFEKIISKCNIDERLALEEWYILDENKIDGEYYLKNRTGSYTDDNVWGAKETQLRDIFIKITETYFENLKEKFTTSATEQEIIEGLFKDEEVTENTIAVFRNGYSDDNEVSEKTELLKNKIVQKLSEDNCQDRIVSLQYDSEYAAKFKKFVTDILKESIQKEIRRLEAAKKAQIHSADFYKEFIERKRTLFVGRNKELEKIEQFIESDKSEGVLWITGQSGCGKSSLAAEYISRCGKDCYYVFFAADESSYTLCESIGRMCSEIENRKTAVNKRNITETFFNAVYSLPSNKKSVIIIDGFESFYDIEDIHENIFPAKIPSNVKIIVTTADSTLPEKLSGENKKEIYVDFLSEEEGRSLFYEMLRQKSRCISNKNQEAEIEKRISKGCLPLQLYLMAEYCSGWHSGDEVEQLADTPEEIVRLYIDSMFKKFGHNKDLICSALALIAVSPFGICEDEMQKLLMCFDGVKNHFLSESRYSHDLETLPLVVWSRVYFDFKDSMVQVNFHGQYAIRFVHQIFYKVIFEYLADYCEKASEKLVSFYLGMNNYANNEKKTPNTRKIISVIPLLKKHGDTERISTILQDMSFIDASIKANNLSSLSDESENRIVVEENQENKNNLGKIYSCLQRNYEELSCYRGNFFSCAYADGLISEKNSFLIRERNSKADNNVMVFPYASDADVYWSDDATKYAVCIPNYVCVCITETQKELSRIYLKTHDREKSEAVIDLVWIDNSVIAFSCGEKLMIYDVSQSVPKLLDTVECKSNAKKLMYISEKKLLIFFVSSKINAYSIKQKEVIYSQKIKELFAIQRQMIYDRNKNQLMVSAVKRCIICCDAETGEVIRKIKVPYKRKTYKSWFESGEMWLLENEKIFAATDPFDEGTYITKIIDLNGNKVKYIYPPQVLYVKTFIVGRKYVVFAYENLLLCIDLTDERYPISAYKVEGINKVFWKEKDKTIAILCSRGLVIAELEDFFVSQNFRNCYCGNIALLDSFKNSYAGVKKTLLAIKRYFWFFHKKCNAGYVYENYFSWSLPLLDLFYEYSASLAVEADDGKLAVAYEMDDAVRILDKNGKCFCVFDKLNLALNDSILKMDFSPDSKYIMIWRNFNISVVDLGSLKNVLNLNLEKRPVLNAEFSDDSTKLSVTLCDENVYIYSFDEKKWDNKLPQILQKRIKKSPYFSVYKWNPHNKKSSINKYVLKDKLSRMANAQLWLNGLRTYIGEEHYLLFGKNHCFYLDGKTKKRFDSGYNDFFEALQYEQQKDSTSLSCFIREKNDVTSQILEAGKYIILVSKSLSSVIVFDTENFSVVETYKHHGKIIGTKFNNRSIILYSDKTPNKTKLEINLPEN